MPGISGFNRYEINGLISTDKPVYENLERICNNAGAWLSYDAYTGLWSVIINQPGESVRSFDDSNIIGRIRVSGTSLTDLYNSVEVQFPQRELNDQPDFIRIEIPPEDRNANEPDNTLNITLDLINEQTQAEVLGLMELKQARVDKVITFVSDYTALSLTAGDLIDVTNTQYGFSNKMFRVINLQEQEDDSGQITCEISALEYDPDVYDYDTVDRYTRTTADGIVTKGAIGTPSTPQITKFEKDARPRVLLEGIVPSGIVEGMEFWTSSDNSTFILAGTEYPTAGGVWTAGATARFDYDNINGGNVYAKVRGVNSTTVGPFSATASAVYTPVQTTDAIGADTALTDENGINIPIALALSLLLSKLTSLFGSGDSNKSLIEKLIDNNIVDNLIGAGMDLTQGSTLTVAASTFTNNLNASVAGYTTANGYNLSNVAANTTNVTFTTTTTYKILEISVQSPNMNYDYEFLDQNGTQRTAVGIVAQPPLGIEVVTGTPASPGTVLDSATLDWQSNTITFNLTNVAPGNYFVRVAAFPTYALNMYWPRSLSSNQWGQIYPINYSNPGNNVLKVFLKGIE